MSVITTGSGASAASLDGSGPRQTQHAGANPDRVVFLYRLTSGANPCRQPQQTLVLCASLLGPAGTQHALAGTGYASIDDV